MSRDPYFRKAPFDSAMQLTPAVWALGERLRHPCPDGLLLRLWSWAQQGASAGVRGDLRVAALERSIRWTGKRGVFVQAAIAEGFITDDGVTLVVVPWEDVIRPEWTIAPTVTEQSETDAVADGSAPQWRKNANEKRRLARLAARSGEADDLATAADGEDSGEVGEVGGEGHGEAPNLPGEVAGEVGEGLNARARTENQTQTETEKKTETETNTEKDTQTPAANAAVLPFPGMGGEGKSKSASKKEAGRRAKPPRKGDVVTPTGEVAEVWGHYRTNVTSRSLCTKERADLIAGWLEPGKYSAADLKRCIDGYRHSRFHQGENDRRTKYLSIELWFKDAKHIDDGIEMPSFTGQPLQRGKPRQADVTSQTDDDYPELATMRTANG